MKSLALSAFAAIALAFVCSLGSAAQKISFGYIAYDKVLRSMPDYAVAQERVKTLREQYNKEAEYNEDKFYKMYAEYIQGQKTFPEEIMLKRQKELQVAMEQGISFRKDAVKLLSDAEKELLKPLRDKLDKAIAHVAKERGLAFVANTDAHAYPYINPADGIDVAGLVQLVLEGKPIPTTGVVDNPVTETIEADDDVEIN